MSTALRTGVGHVSLTFLPHELELRVLPAGDVHLRPCDPLVEAWLRRCVERIAAQGGGVVVTLRGAASFSAAIELARSDAGVARAPKGFIRCIGCGSSDRYLIQGG